MASGHEEDFCRYRDRNLIRCASRGALGMTSEAGTTFGGVVYECVRCGTKSTAEQLAALPEIKCICGYRVFKKTRPPVVKQIKAV